HRLRARQHRHRRVGEPGVVQEDHPGAWGQGRHRPGHPEVDGEWRLRGRGWTSDGGNLWEVLERLDAEGVSRLLVTDVSRDGMLNGPNVELLREVSAATSAPVVASGGISSLDDIRALAAVVDEGVDSAIVGKALYAG